jgi:hypothetical protein
MKRKHERLKTVAQKVFEAVRNSNERGLTGLMNNGIERFQVNRHGGTLKKIKNK